jgi:hypothetical protein
MEEETRVCKCEINGDTETNDFAYLHCEPPLQEPSSISPTGSQTLDIVSMLPVEISLRILSYLSVFELVKSVSYVCSRWYELSRDLSLWNELDVSENNHSHIGHDGLMAIRHQLTRLRKLDVAGRDDLTLVTFVELCPCLLALRTLNLGFCGNIGRPYLRTICRHCQGLEELNLEGCHNIDSRCLIELKDLNLKHINLSHCDRLEEEDVVAFLNSQPGLCFLDIDGIPCISSPVCLEIAKLSSTLTVLHIDGASMEDECLKCISKCLHLTEIQISFCELFTDDGLWYLHSLTCLKSVCLKKGFKFSSVGLVQLFEAWKLVESSNMVYLNLTECLDVDDSVVGVIATTCSSLRELHLAWCWEITDTGLLSIIHSMRELRHLNLCGLRQIVGIPLRHVPSNQQHLQRLDCTQCHCLS